MGSSLSLLMLRRGALRKGHVRDGRLQLRGSRRSRDGGASRGVRRRRVLLDVVRNERVQGGSDGLYGGGGVGDTSKVGY